MSCIGKNLAHTQVINIPAHLHRRTQAQQHTPTSIYSRYSGKYIAAIYIVYKDRAKATKHNPHTAVVLRSSMMSEGGFQSGRQIVRRSSAYVHSTATVVYYIESNRCVFLTHRLFLGAPQKI